MLGLVPVRIVLCGSRAGINACVLPLWRAKVLETRGQGGDMASRRLVESREVVEEVVENVRDYGGHDWSSEGGLKDTHGGIRTTAKAVSSAKKARENTRPSFRCELRDL